MIYKTSSQTNLAWVLTAAHVVAGESQVSVTVGDSLTYIGFILGRDVDLDVAVIRVCCSDSFEPIPIGDSAVLRQGDDLIAVGYPLSVTDSARVTRGVVSAVVSEPAIGRTLIQTDAALNPGNSGGPVVNMSGQVVGIVSFAIRDKAGIPIEGTGFAVAQESWHSLLSDLESGLVVAPIPSPTVVRKVGVSTGATLGPINGTILHDPSLDTIKQYDTGLIVDDLRASVSFQNPYGPKTGTWDYGFMFRHSNSDTFHVVAVRNDGQWLHWLRIGGEEQHISSGESEFIRTGQGENNEIELIAVSGRGWLTINGSVVGHLDLSGLTGQGDLFVITGIYPGSEATGASTSFRDLTINDIEPVFIGEPGNLIKKDGFIAGNSSGVQVRNGYFRATFTNPSLGQTGETQNSSYGLIFRNVEPGTFFALITTTDGRWALVRRNSGKTTDFHIEDGAANALYGSPGRSNTIEIVALETFGQFFVNGQIVANLNLSTIGDLGDVVVFAGYYRDHQQTGTITAYRDFTVWSFD